MSHANVMLATLSMSAWTARKYDRRLSKEVTDNHNTAENAARVNKNLLPWEVGSYESIHSSMSKTREIFNQESLPWLDVDGTRMVAAKNYLTLTEKMRARRSEFEGFVSVFKHEAPALFQRAQMVLNGMYRAEDYPDETKLAKKFSFSLKFFPLPDASDFRVEELTDDAVKAIQSQIETNVQDGISSAIGDLYDRLHQVVEHMASRLEGRSVCNCKTCKGRTFKTDQFNDTLVENVREVCEVIPRLNFTNDPRLELYRQQVMTGLAEFEAQQLRDNDAVRRIVGQRAEEIGNAMAAFMGGV